ncbi:MAG: Holliday junction resolvase RuvX [bacterium]
MNLLSIDYGTKNIGLAMNNGTEIAFPFKTIFNNDNVIQEIKDTCDEEMIEKIVMGMPTKMNPKKNFSPFPRGREEGVLAGEIKDFAKKLKEAVKLEITFEDELLSSEMAGKMMEDYGGKYEKDAIEAAVILQSYMDKNS